MQQKDVFISYGSKDYDRVLNFRDVLERNDVTCWMAPRDIPVGSNYANEIPSAIRYSKIFLVMLSRASQESLWVPKELSQALTEHKTVFPVMLESCELNISFNFSLTDVQRFNAYDGETGSLQSLIDRIKKECKKQSSENLEIENKEILLLDEMPSDTNKLLTWLSQQKPAKIKRMLAVFLKDLRYVYRNNPNAQIVEKWIWRQKFENFPAMDVIEQLARLELCSSAVADIDIQVALICIHTGDKKYISMSRKHLQRAILGLTAHDEYDENTFKKIVYARWLVAVAYKQDRNFGIANDLCEELVAYVKSENEVFDVPYADALLLPERELVVINKERIMGDYLRGRMQEISYNVKELFFTQRRLLEYYILENDFVRAGEIVPELLDSFLKCKDQVDAIYQVGLYQNLFEYYTYIGDKNRAQRNYKAAFSLAQQNFWKGKQRRLEDLKTIYS